MKLNGFVAAVAGGVLLVSCNQATENKEIKLANENDSLSYAFGVDIASNLERNEINGLNTDALAQGFKDNESDNLKMTPEEAGQFIRGYFDKKTQEEASANKTAGEDFLAENAKNPDVKTTQTGLQYIVLKEGNGPIPQRADKVLAHYHGTLIDGTVFDSSVERGEPAAFEVDRVIPGWTEALTMMPVGSKWKLFIPSELGYGDRGAGGKIKPGSVLIFEVELLEILPSE